MKTFQAAFLVFLAFLISVNCAVENSTASEYGTESTADDSHCASSPCRNGGTCINRGDNYTCMCPEEYGGKNCSENRVCEIYGEELCGNAKCSYDEQRDDYNCTCKDGKVYDTLSRRCIVDPCASNPCKNGGTCMVQRGRHTCLCRAMYSGKDCSEFSWCYFNGHRACGQATCNYNVASRRVSCSCPSNKVFDEKLKICKSGKSACQPDPCIYGRCIEIDNREFSCICSAKYTGKFCNETIIDACTSKPCKNGGKCYTIGRNFACICTYFYSGMTCNHGNAATISSLVVSLGVVVILTVLCGLFCHKRNQSRKKMPTPGIHLAPLPAMAPVQAPRPAMASEQAPRPAMALQQAPRPGMALQQASRPAMASEHAPGPAMASEHGQTNIYPTVPRF